MRQLLWLDVVLRLFIFLEALADAGVQIGLPRDLALQL